MDKIIDQLKNYEEVCWENPKKENFEDFIKKMDVKPEDIDKAAADLDRYASYIAKVFEETRANKGIVESPLKKINGMKEDLDTEVLGDLYLKMDSNLPVAGSVKARGGMYEVLKHTEDLAVKEGLIQRGDPLDSLVSDEAKKVLSKYIIQVGSTGNLGISIGITSAKIGYKVIVHMSSDAKEWKKELLRSYGVEVKEYDSNYSLAVTEGRKESDQDPLSYFVDDENSKILFLGYAVAGRRLRKQLEEDGAVIDEENPLYVYIPCGVGGAPGGVSFGLKCEFKDNVHIYFVEPTHAPCMLLGMATGKHGDISVEDIGLDGKTEADGLAVGRPSSFVGGMMDPILDGIVTLDDGKLNPYMQALYKREGIFIEPSAAASFAGLEMTKGKKGSHVLWATGGALVPKEIRDDLLKD